jgi:hypothetical protein
MLHKTAKQREQNSRGIFDPAALPQIKALLFDAFGTVVDWRSSLIAELSEFGRRRPIGRS